MAATIVISVPPDPLSGSVQVTVTCSSPSAKSVRLYVDGGSQGVPAAPDVSPPWNFTFDTTQVLDGQRVLTADCTLSNKSTQSASKTVTVTNAAVTPPPTVTISGTASQGSTLTANPSPAGSYTYRWRRCDTAGNPLAIADLGTASTYTLLAADVGYTIKVTVTSVSSGLSGTSAPTAAVTGTPTPPVNTSLPTISGTATEGQTLAATPGTWSGSPPNYAYQWLRGATAVGTNSPNYTLTSSDVGSTMSVRVTATNGAGSAQATSASTAVVASAGVGPVSPMLDSFGGTLANWINPTLDPMVTAGGIVKAAVTPYGGGIWWNGANPTWADGELYLTVPTLPAVGQAFFLRWRAQNAARTGAPVDNKTWSGYYAWFDPSAQTLTVYRFDGTTSTQIPVATGSGSGISMAAGMTFWVKHVGATITIQRKPSGGAWTPVATFTNAVYSQGWHGFSISDNIGTADDYGAGAFAVAPDTTKPTVPQGLTASNPSSSTVTLGWSASSDNVAVVGYGVYRNGVLVAPASGLTFTDTGLQASTSYTYTVDAYDAAGNRSNQSASAAATTAAALAPPANTSLPTIAPTSPVVGQTLTAGPGSWTGNPTGYTYAWLRGATTIGSGAAYTPVSADVGSTLSVRVTASNAAGSGTPATSAATAVVVVASGTILWRGDYSTGNFLQWEGHQWSRSNDQGYDQGAVGDSSAVLLTAPNRAQFTIYGGSALASDNTARAEVYASGPNTGSYNGQTWYYAWSTYIPAESFTNWSSNFNVITTLGHSVGSVLIVPLSIGINAMGATPYIYAENQDISGNNVAYTNIGNLVTDAWIDFVARVDWTTVASPVPPAGRVQLWRNGLLVFDSSGNQTLSLSNPDGSSYWKQGVYIGHPGSSAPWPTNISVIHACARRGDTYASVSTPCAKV